MVTAQKDIPLYRQIADKLEELITSGTFSSGEKIPSVRQMSRDHRVSISTVMGAYALLEDRGRIEGRSRSGYFVKARLMSRANVPKAALHRNKPVEVSRASIVEAVLAAIQQPEVVPFGAATPGDELCPHTRLNTLSNVAVRQLGPAAYRYTVVPGREDLRTQIAKRSLRCGEDLSPSDIITTMGATEALLLALKATTKPGDVVAVENPTYYGILDLISALGLQAIEIPQSPEKGMDLDALCESIRAHSIKACVVQPNFQNPMGSTMPDENKRLLVKICADAGIALVEDALYSDLYFGESHPFSLKTFDETGIVLQCSGFSKSLSPGLRVGWIVPGKFYDQVKQLRTSLGLATCTISEVVVSEFLKNGGFDRHLRRVRSVYFRQLQQVRQGIIDAFPKGVCMTEPKGGFILWVQLPEPIDAEKLVVDALLEKISLVPGTLCSASCQFRNTIRINCGHSWTPRLERALGVLGHLAKLQCR